MAAVAGAVNQPAFFLDADGSSMALEETGPFVLVDPDLQEPFPRLSDSPEKSRPISWSRGPILASSGALVGKYAIQHLGPIEIQDHTAERVVRAVKEIIINKAERKEDEYLQVRDVKIKLGPNLNTLSPLTLMVKDGKAGTFEITRRGGPKKWTIDPANYHALERVGTTLQTHFIILEEPR